MVFYKIEAERVINEGETGEYNRAEYRTLASCLCEKSEAMYQKFKEKAYVFGVRAKGRVACFGAITRENDSVESFFDEFKKYIPFEVGSYKAVEITLRAFTGLLRGAFHDDFIASDDEVYEKFGIKDIDSRGFEVEFGEAFVEEEMTSQKAKEISDSHLFSETLAPEIDRIFKYTAKTKACGHPVHYIVQSGDRETRKAIYRVILSSLYAVGRLKNKRYCYVDYNSESRVSVQGLEALYKSSEHGAFVIRYGGFDDGDSEYSNQGSGVVEALCDIAKKYKNKVLTVICFAPDSKKIKDDFLLNWGTTTFIEVKEDIAFKAQAEAYLKNKAKENKIRSDKNLMNAVKNGRGYTAKDLNLIFDSWYDKKLRLSIYPQYRELEPANVRVKSKKYRGGAYESLQEMIGLGEAKKLISSALNYYKAQKLFASRGLIEDRPSMHMVFTGNPGTAKTSVARLFARIMKENGMLLTGEIFEVGRAQLVGKYVGQTAPLVRQAFKRAMGGVLFIDEAYSLVDHRDGLYGDEAINTIVQEMENYRDEIVVIFAGYPDKMEEFLNKNPGLRSRIAFHVPFEDYNTDELCDIAKKISKEKGMILSDGALTKMRNMFEKAREESDFGNGRYVRNVIEKAKMAQANRLMDMDFDRVTDEEIITIREEDIEELDNKDAKALRKKPIGFCA